ncbi:MAG TPA: hypothetical protein VGM88_28885 [Kofleriaceae bacterium]
MLLLDERILADGVHARTWARLADDARVELSEDLGPTGSLSIGALDRVMARYGRPLEAGVAAEGEALELPGGYRLRRLRFHAIVDATGRDYLVWERPDGEPLAAVATMVTAALRYLVARLADATAGRTPPQETET